MVNFEPDLTPAVEAAAKNHWQNIFASSDVNWDDLDPMTQLAIREMVLPAVHKAAPLIAAQTLRWAAVYDTEVSSSSLSLWAEEIEDGQTK